VGLPLLRLPPGLGVVVHDQVPLSARWGRAREPGDLGPPEQPVVLERALDLLASRLGIDPASLADTERLSLDTLSSLLADVVSDDVLKPAVPVADLARDSARIDG
jgi:hypothetical protein